MTSRGISDTKILQLAHQGLGFCELAVDLKPSLVQQGLQSRNQRQFRHTPQITPSRVSAVPAVINTPKGEMPE